MVWVWYVGVGLFGLAIGLHFGRLLAAIFRYGFEPRSSFDLMKQVVTFVLVTVGGTTLLGLATDSVKASFYVLGLGAGLVLAWIHPRLPACSPTDLKGAIEVEELLPRKVQPHGGGHLALLLAVPPRLVAQAKEIDHDQLATEFEAALDVAGEQVEAVVSSAHDLPEPNRSIVLKVLVEEQPLSKVAESMNITVEQVKAILREAMQRIEDSTEVKG